VRESRDPAAPWKMITDECNLLEGFH